MMKTLRDLRIEAGLTLAELAMGIGTGHGNISQWENGKATPSARFYPRLAKALGQTSETIRIAVEQSAAERTASAAK